VPLVEHGLLEEGASLYEPANIRLMHYLNASLRAHALFHRDVDYIVQKPSCRSTFVKKGTIAFVFK
jgi:preprotein translocase subunit SecA